MDDFDLLDTVIDFSIGNLPDEDNQITEMARIGYIGEYEIYVNTNDAGNTPHFHVRDKNDWSKFHTCIEFMKPVYFHHGNKQSTLDVKMKKDLITFFKFPANVKRSRDKGLTNWDLACDDWNRNNSDVQLPDDLQMPNYNLL